MDDFVNRSDILALLATRKPKVTYRGKFEPSHKSPQSAAVMEERKRLADAVSAIPRADLAQAPAPTTQRKDDVMADMQEVRAAFDDLEAAIAACEKRCIAAGAYMPGFATRLRIYADELAEKHPDETNGGLDALERL